VYVASHKAKQVLSRLAGRYARYLFGAAKSQSVHHFDCGLLQSQDALGAHRRLSCEAEKLQLYRISLNSFKDLRAIYGDAAMSEALHSVVTFLKKDACPSIACYVNAGHFVLLVKPGISADTEVKHITALVDSYGIPHEMIELEITETTTIDLLLGA
jgi:predicted signal transduction protein with EAL and GGDEF domain